MSDDLFTPTIEVGDLIESVEVKWPGIVVAIETDGNGDTMLKCHGLDLIAWALEGRSVSKSICEDDTAWYAPADVVLMSKKPEGGWK